jgi:hypothetical protein
MSKKFVQFQEVWACTWVGGYAPLTWVKVLRKYGRGPEISCEENYSLLLVQEGFLEEAAFWGES